MQVLEAGVCQLSNFEVYNCLQNWRKVRGTEQILPSEAVFKLETSLLVSTFQNEKGLGQEQVDGFLQKVDELCTKYPSPNGQPMYLTPAEKIQIMNSKPQDAMALEVLIEGMVTDERVEESHVVNFTTDILTCVRHFLLRKKFVERAKDLVYISSSDDDEPDHAKDNYYDPDVPVALHADEMPVVVPPVKEEPVIEEPVVDEMVIDVVEETAVGEADAVMKEEEGSGEEEEEVKGKKAKKEKKEKKKKKKEESEEEEEPPKKGKRKPAKKPAKKSSSRKKKQETPSDDSEESSASSSSHKKKKPKAKSKRSSSSKKKPSPSSSESSSSGGKKKRKSTKAKSSSKKKK